MQLTLTQMARKGGKACYKKYGKAYMSKIGKKGAKAKNKKK